MKNLRLNNSIVVIIGFQFIILISSTSFAEKYDHVLQKACSGNEKIIGPRRKASDFINHENHANNQGGIGICYGFSATYLLSDLIGESASVLDTLEQTCKKTVEGGRVFAILHKIREGSIALSDSKKNPGLDYVKFHNSCINALDSELLQLKRQLRLINEIRKTITSQHEPLERKALPCYNVHVYDANDTKDLISKVDEVLGIETMKNNPTPIALSLCMENNSTQCDGIHAVIITGVRKVLCDGETIPRTEWKIKNSWGGDYDGWFDAEKAAQSSLLGSYNITWTEKCGNPPLPKRSDFIIGKHPLHYLAEAEDALGIIKALKDERILKTIDISDKHAQTPLIFATLNGNFEIANALIQAGANVNIPNKDGGTPLNIAAQGGHTAIVRSLIQRKADLNLADRGGGTPLLNAVVFGKSDIVSALVEAKANLNLANKEGYTPLYLAIHYGDFRTAKLLVENGADMNALFHDVTLLRHAQLENTKIYNFMKNYRSFRSRAIRKVHSFKRSIGNAMDKSTTQKPKD